MANQALLRAFVIKAYQRVSFLLVLHAFDVPEVLFVLSKHLLWCIDILYKIYIKESRAQPRIGSLNRLTSLSFLFWIFALEQIWIRPRCTPFTRGLSPTLKGCCTFSQLSPLISIASDVLVCQFRLTKLCSKGLLVAACWAALHYYKLIVVVVFQVY